MTVPNVAGGAPATSAWANQVADDVNATLPDDLAPTTGAAGDAAAAGVVAKAARRDHRHGLPGFGAVAAATTYAENAANGAAATFSRSDHKHGTPILPTPAQIGAPAAYDSPATLDGGKRIYVGTATPTGASEGDIWIKG